MKTVSGLLTPREGTIEFDGRAIAGRSPDAIVALGLVQVPEGRRVFPELSVEDNLRVGAYLVDKRAKLRTALAEVYRRFPRLEERRAQFAGTLSGGEQQLLAFGRAMMSQPKLLMLDEPSLGLAPLMVAEVMRSIRVFRESRRDGIPGRAKCQPGVAPCGSCLRDGDGQHHHEWQRSTTSRRRARTRELSRRESDLAWGKLGTLSSHLHAALLCEPRMFGYRQRAALRGRNDHDHKSTQVHRRRSGRSDARLVDPGGLGAVAGAGQDRCLRADVGQCRGPRAEHTQIGRDGRQPQEFRRRSAGSTDRGRDRRRRRQA